MLASGSDHGSRGGGEREGGTDPNLCWRHCVYNVDSD